MSQTMNIIISTSPLASARAVTGCESSVETPVWVKSSSSLSSSPVGAAYAVVGNSVVIAAAIFDDLLSQSGLVSSICFLWGQSLCQSVSVWLEYASSLGGMVAKRT